MERLGIFLPPAKFMKELGPDFATPGLPFLPSPGKSKSQRLLEESLTEVYEENYGPKNAEPEVPLVRLTRQIAQQMPGGALTPSKDRLELPACHYFQ